jgi:uncharacterized protein YidB (DUF937 family)
MRKTIAAATVGASLAVGGLAGSALGGPGVADAANLAAAQDSTDTTDTTDTTAADEADGRAGWVDEALSGLVEDGTLTQEQADAVEQALEDARPEGFGHRGGGLHADLSTVAEALGLSEDDLRTALEGGQTLAEVAEEQGVDTQEVVDAIVTAQQERLDEAVADGDLTQEQADEIAANAEERVTALVNGEMPAFGGRGGPGGPGGHGGWDGPPGPGDAEEDSGSDTTDSSGTTDSTT